MDTESDFMKESREKSLGASEEGFTQWLRTQHIFKIVKVTELDCCFREEFWNEYLDALEFSKNAEMEKERVK